MNIVIALLKDMVVLSARRVRTSLLAFGASAILIWGVASAATSTADLSVVEFYHAGLRHYFYTASAAEAQGIDQGAAGPGWVRTGLAFSAWSETRAPAGAAPVCRFYAAGPNSHFYTASAGECAYLRELEAQQRNEAQQRGTPFLGWGYEGIAYYAFLPRGQAADGTPECNFTGASTRVYRAYNGLAAENNSNHRLTGNASTYAWMLNNHWLDESVAFCVASSSYALPSGVTSPPDGGPRPGETVLLKPLPLSGTYYDPIASWIVAVPNGPTSLVIEQRKPLTLTFDGRGSFVGQGFGCQLTAQELTRSTSGPISAYIYTRDFLMDAVQCTDPRLIGQYHFITTATAPSPTVPAFDAATVRFILRDDVVYTSIEGEMTRQ